MIEIKGLKELQERIERLQKNASGLDGTHVVPLTQILSPSFLRQHTRFGSVEELFGEWKLDGEGFKALSDEQKDELTRSSTSFQSWHDLIQAGAKEYAKAQLFK